MKTNNLLRSMWSFILVFAFAFILSLQFGTTKVLAAYSSATTTDAAQTINVTEDGEITKTPNIIILINDLGPIIKIIDPFFMTMFTSLQSQMHFVWISLDLVLSFQLTPNYLKHL